jgi:multiple sugar transport system permease protein
MLGPTFLFVGIVTAIGYLQMFAEPYVMTYGGPLNRTLSAVMLMYQQGFRFWRMGYAAAIAFVLFLMVGAATLIQLRFQEKR